MSSMSPAVAEFFKKIREEADDLRADDGRKLRKLVDLSPVEGWVFAPSGRVYKLFRGRDGPRIDEYQWIEVREEKDGTKWMNMMAGYDDEGSGVAFDIMAQMLRNHGWDVRPPVSQEERDRMTDTTDQDDALEPSDHEQLEAKKTWEKND